MADGISRRGFIGASGAAAALLPALASAEGVAWLCVCVLGRVANVSVRRIRGSQRMLDVTLESETPTALSVPLVLRWFNAFWVEKTVAVSQRLVVFGKPKQSGRQLVMAHPEFEVVEEEGSQSIHLQRIVPVHPASEGLSPRVIREAVAALIDDRVDVRLAVIAGIALAASGAHDDAVR
jgi:RecG-like helicase